MQRAVFEEKIPAMLAASTFPAEKEKGGLSARQNFLLYQNFQMQVCKQYYKNRVNIHSQVFDS